jgi:hypothetical protein
MAFDVEGARKAGYSDGDIADYLAAKKEFNITGARKAGYENSDIITHLLGPKKEPESRHVGAVLNDTVISIANSAAGGVKSAADFFSPGTDFSKAIDEFIKHGEESQSDIVKAGREKFQKELQGAQTAGEEISAVGKYVAQNPLQAAGQAAGSIAGPGLAIKGFTKTAQLLKFTEKVAERIGLGAGIVTNAAMSGGDAAGSAYDMVMQTPDDILMQNNFVRQEVEKGRSLEDVKKEAATTAARRASAVPALIGGATGAFGIESILAGTAKPSASRLAGALKTGLSEALQESVEEGATELSANVAAKEYDPRIDPTKGVAGAAALGAVLGAGPGAAIGALNTPQTLPPNQLADSLEDGGLKALEAAYGEMAKITQVGQPPQEEENLGPVKQGLPFGTSEEQIANVIDQVEKSAEQKEAPVAPQEISPEIQVKQAEIETLKKRLEDKDYKGEKHRTNIVNKIEKLEGEVQAALSAPPVAKDQDITSQIGQGDANAQPSGEANAAANQSGAASSAPAMDGTPTGTPAPINAGMGAVGGAAQPTDVATGDQSATLTQEQNRVAEEERLAELARLAEALPKEENADRPEIVQQRATLERVLPKTIGNFTLGAITPYAGNWTVNYTYTNESGAIYSTNVPIDAEMLEGKTDAEIETAIRERAAKNGLREPTTDKPIKLDYKTTERIFTPEQTPFASDNVEGRDRVPTDIKEAENFAAAETAFDLMDSAESGVNKELDAIAKEKGISVKGDDAKETKALTREAVIAQMSEKEFEALVHRNVSPNKLTGKRKESIEKRNQFINTLSEAQKKSIEKKAFKKLGEEIKARSSFSRTTESDKRKAKQKTFDAAAYRRAARKLQKTEKEAKTTEKKVKEVEAKPDIETYVSSSERKIVGALKTGEAVNVLAAIQGNYKPSVSVRIDTITQAIAQRLKAIMIELDDQPNIIIGKVEGGRPGKYDPETETITIDPTAPRKVSLDVVILHEMTHYMSDHVIDNRDKLTPEQKNAVLNLEKLYKYVQNKLGHKFDIPTLKEFIAEAFSNPAFQTAMGRLDVPSNYDWRKDIGTSDNFLTTFAKRILQLLGFPRDTSPGVLYSALVNIQSIIKIEPVGKAQGVSYMAKKAGEEEPFEESIGEFIARQPLPPHPDGVVNSMRRFFNNGLSRGFKEAARLFQSARYPVEDWERTIRRSGLLEVGDENSFNNIATQIALATGNARNLDNTYIKKHSDRVEVLVADLVKAEGTNLDTVLQKLGAYGIVMHESEVRKVKFLREVGKKYLRDDDASKVVDWFGEKVTPATAAANIQKDLSSKNFSKKAESVNMTSEELALEYRKFMEQLVARKDFIKPNMPPEKLDVNNTDYHVVGQLTADRVARFKQYFNAEKNVGLIKEIYSELNKLSEATIELNKQANYWSPQVTNLKAFYNYKHYAPFKGKPLTNEDKELFITEFIGKEYQQAEYTQEGRISLPDNPVLRMLAEGSLSAARAGRKDVIKAVFHSSQPNKYNKDGQGLIDAQVVKFIPFENRYMLDSDEELKTLARNKELFFYYMEDGDIAIIRMKDEKLRNSIRNTYRQSNYLLDRVNSINSFFGQMHTRFSVGFAPKNFVRDAITNTYNISIDLSPGAASRYIGAIAENVTKAGMMKAWNVASTFREAGADPAKNPKIKALIDRDKTGFTKDLVEYLLVGGDVAYVNSLTTKGQFKEFTKLNRADWYSDGGRAISDFFDNYTAMFEYTSRVSAYQIAKSEEMKRLMAKGVPRAQAEKDAIKPAVAFSKNLANFEKVGVIGRQAGAWFMFFRPAATGAVRAIESLAPSFSSVFGGYEKAADRAWNQAPKEVKAKGKKAEEEYKKEFIRQAKNGKATAAVAMGLGVAMYYMSYLMSGEDDMDRNRVATDDMTRWQRDARFFVGPNPNDVVNVPWGYGIGAFAAFGAQIASLGMSDESFLKTMSNTVPIMMDSFMPLPISRGSPIENPLAWALDSIMPSVIRPLMEYEMNYNSLGQQIYNNRQSFVGSTYTGGDNIPEIYKSVARNLYELSDYSSTFKFDPNVLYFFANSYMDALAKFNQTSFNLYLVGIGERDPDLMEALKRDTLLLEGFVGTASSYDARKWNAVEKDLERRKAALNEIKDDPIRYLEYMQANPMDQMLVDMYNGDANGELKKLRHESKEIRLNSNLTVQERTDQLRENKLQLSLLMMQLVDMYEAFEVKP